MLTVRVLKRGPKLSGGLVADEVEGGARCTKCRHFPLTSKSDFGQKLFQWNSIELTVFFKWFLVVQNPAAVNESLEVGSDIDFGGDVLLEIFHCDLGIANLLEKFSR